MLGSDRDRKIESLDITNFKKAHGSTKVIKQEQKGIISAVYDLPSANKSPLKQSTSKEH